MGRMRWVLACVPLVVAATALGGGCAGARGTGPCAEDPSDCGLAPTIAAVSDQAGRERRRGSARRSTRAISRRRTRSGLAMRHARAAPANARNRSRKKRSPQAGAFPYKRPRDVKAIIGLTPGCTYGYWFVASNERGTVETEHEYFVAAGGEPGARKHVGASSASGPIAGSGTHASRRLEPTRLPEVS